MRIYQNGTIDIPHDLNLTQLLHRNAGDKPLPESHLIAKDSLTNRSLTIGALRSRAGRIAHGFQRRLQPRDQARWMVIVPNSVDFVELFHAIVWSGGVACPVNHELVAAEIAHAMTVARPHFILAYAPELDKVLRTVQLWQEHCSQHDIDWDRPEIITVLGKASGYKCVPDDFLDDATLPIPHYDDTSKRVATINLSSGTTGKPKGVELSHRNYVANCYQLYKHDPAQFPPTARHVAYTPYVHIAQTMPAIFFAPWTGMMYHAMPAFEMEAYARLAESNQSTHHLLISTVALNLASTDITSRYDFSPAKYITIGQLSMDSEQMSQLISRAPWRVVALYGMTETSPYVAYQKMDEDVPIGTVGQLLPGVEVMLKREDGEDAAEGGPGELWVRGPNVTRGYAFNEPATKAAFPLPGWYNTGDVCTMSKEGWLTVVGRTKELIKYKGFQVSPTELETHLNSHPLVEESAVGPRFDKSQLTEVPTGYIILKTPHQSQAQKKKALRDIQSAIDNQVSGYKKLRGGLWEVSELPKGATGKFLRAKLHEGMTGISSLDDGHRLAKL